MDKILVFGRGNYLKNKYETLSHEHKIVGILDNSVPESDWDEEYHVPVYHPSMILTLEEYPIWIMSIHFVEMCKQLLELGVKEDRIHFGCFLKPFDNMFEEKYLNRESDLFIKNGEIYYTYNNSSNKTRVDHVETIKKFIREQIRQEDAFVDALINSDCQPYSRYFGMEQGTPIDRYYIEQFLSKYQDDISGIVMEVADDTYIKKFGGKKVSEKIILHVNGVGDNVLKGNFETKEGLHDEMVDCLVCTQTLQYIYDVRRAVRNIYDILRPGGVALITVPGIKSISQVDQAEFGEYWSFTRETLSRLCEECTDSKYFSVEVYGNVKSTIGYLYGICEEDLTEEDLDYEDPQYPFLVCARIKKVR